MTETIPSSSRLASLDLGRALASLGVVAIHASAAVASQAQWRTSAWWFTNILQSFAFWAVPFFFSKCSVNRSVISSL